MQSCRVHQRNQLARRALTSKLANRPPTRPDADAEADRLIAPNPDLRLTRFDTADYLHDEADATSYLEATGEDGDPRTLGMAQDAVGRARVHQARDTHRTRRPRPIASSLNS